MAVEIWQAVIGFLGAALGAYVAAKQALPERLLIPELYKHSAEAFRKLFSLTEIAAASVVGDMSLEKRQEACRLLTEWYYKDGNGIFLDGITRDSLFNLRRRLLTIGEAKRCNYDFEWPKGWCDKNPTDMPNSIRKAASDLRGELKRQLGVYKTARLFERGKMEE